MTGRAEVLGDLVGQFGKGPAGEQRHALAAGELQSAHVSLLPLWCSCSVSGACRLAAASAAAVPARCRCHPACHVALPGAPHAQRTGRHVLDDHRTGRGVGAVADRDRRHEHVVGPGPGVVADHRAVLVHAVVVDEHGGRADVGVLADAGVADVAQMRHLGAGADVGSLDLDVGSDVHLVGQFGAGPQVGERADGDAGADPGPDRPRCGAARCRRRPRCRSGCCPARSPRRPRSGCAPCSWTFGASIDVGCEHAPSASTQVVAGSITVTPFRMCCSSSRWL